MKIPTWLINPRKVRPPKVSFKQVPPYSFVGENQFAFSRDPKDILTAEQVMSCIVLTVYDAKNKAGAVVHIRRTHENITKQLIRIKSIFKKNAVYHVSINSPGATPEFTKLVSSSAKDVFGGSIKDGGRDVEPYAVSSFHLKINDGSIQKTTFNLYK